MFCQKCGTQNPEDGRFCRSCGSDLTGGTAALAMPEFEIDSKGKRRSRNPDDIWGHAIRNMLSGLGFLIMAVVLLTTNVAGGHKWWWAMLFPAFSLLATGISQYAKVKRIEKQRAAYYGTQQPQFNPPPQNAALPPNQTDYVAPQRTTPPGSIYDTSEFELRPPSVTEGTTRHLQIKKDDEQ